MSRHALRVVHRDEAHLAGVPPHHVAPAAVAGLPQQLREQPGGEQHRIARPAVDFRAHDGLAGGGEGLEQPVDEVAR